MYQILLVDDEPLILSGIKFMINWNSYGCEIAATARNGQQALDFMRQNPPDVVICDISMPLISGTELLEIASKEMPEVAFIMLTNYQDFHLAQQSLRFQAIDYLLKNELTPEILAASLQKACTEHDRRKKISTQNSIEHLTQASRQHFLSQAILGLLEHPAEANNSAEFQILLKNKMLTRYTCLFLPLDYTSLPNAENLSLQERIELMKWQLDITRKLAENSFPKQLVFSYPDNPSALYLYIWDIDPVQWQTSLSLFKGKLSTASSTFTQLEVPVLEAPVCSGNEGIVQCCKNLQELKHQYYLFWPDRCPDCRNPVIIQSLNLTGVNLRLKKELNEKCAPGCNAIFKKVIQQIKTVPHLRGQAVWLCQEISDTIREVIGSDTDWPLSQFSFLTYRKQFVEWLEFMNKKIAEWAAQQSSDKTEVLAKARQYVRTNWDKRIMLQDVADYVYISPGYLSSLHKKIYNQNFVDYIHQIKIEHACEMIREGKYRIYEIGEMLNIGNPCYFSRIFKRYIGMTPKEYQKKFASGSRPEQANEDQIKN